MVVTARDGGAEPRTATATVTVVVLDLPDESPKFEKARYEVDVPEGGLPDLFVARVQAIDADAGQASVTYAIRRGDADKFSIDGRTGDVRTKKPLDYERQVRRRSFFFRESSFNFFFCRAGPAHLGDRHGREHGPGRSTSHDHLGGQRPRPE